MISSLDFIGDIHGHFEELKELLLKLGYREERGAFRYPGNSRKVVFLGDYIDRGPQVRDVVNLVRAMKFADSAEVLLGNHEFNALSFWQKNQEFIDNKKNPFYLKSFKDGYLREHSFNKIAVHAQTIHAYTGRQSEFLEVLDFFKSLPFYLDEKLFCAQHAGHDFKAIAFLKEKNIRCFLDGNFDALIAQMNDEFHDLPNSLFEIIWPILKGHEIKLSEGNYFYDSENVKRKKTRIRWWVNPKKATFEELVFQPGIQVPNDEIPLSIRELDFYDENQKPVFFGHYWLKGTPKLLRHNVCCLDYSVATHAGNGHLVAYRFDGENILDEKKFVYVSEK